MIDIHLKHKPASEPYEQHPFRNYDKRGLDNRIKATFN